MKLFNFDIKYKEVKKQGFILTGQIHDKEVINNLINFVKNNKNEKLSYQTSVKGHFTGFKSLINNEDFHKFLKLIKDEMSAIYPIDRFIIKDCWGNILKKGEEIIEHRHGNTAFCGVIYLTEGGPGTYFSEYVITIEEKIGGFILFNPILAHSVKKMEQDIERITIAFNMDAIKDWEVNKEATYIS